MNCFNPCYSGSNSKIKKVEHVYALAKGFNPCYSGSNSKMTTGNYAHSATTGFQSLL